MLGGTAFATTVTTCNTGPLKDCFVSAEGLDSTEAIAKIDFQKGGSGVLTVNPNFSGVMLSDFDLSGVVLDDDNEVAGGIIKYTLRDGIPGMTAFST